MSATRSAVLGVAGTRLTLDGRPFPLTGVSFFNALYNPTFNRSAGERERRLRTFRDWGVNTLRVWCQWDFAPPRSFIETAPEHSLYASDGSLREPDWSPLHRAVFEHLRRTAPALER
jgi:hypothetical protein